MARVATRRLDAGRRVLGNCHRLPFADGSVDAVSAVWLLHLLPDAPSVIAECARVLRPGGVFVTTVDKAAGHGTDSDVEELLAPFRVGKAYDAAPRVLAVASEHGLRRVGEARFTGHGQGRSPAGTASEVAHGDYSSLRALDARQLDVLVARLSGLPDPEVPRADPVYRLLALRKEH
jgi:SAM-dependent methyltransferase